MSAMRTVLPIAAVALVAALSGLAFADAIYKWVDSNGVTHYGEKAPQGTKASTVKVEDTTSSDADDALKKLSADRAAAADAKKKADKDAATRKGATAPGDLSQAATACEQHRKNLETLQSGKRVRAQDSDGKPRELGDEEIKSQIEFAQDELKRCEQRKQLQDATSKAPPAPTR